MYNAETELLKSWEFDFDDEFHVPFDETKRYNLWGDLTGRLARAIERWNRDDYNNN